MLTCLNFLKSIQIPYLCDYSSTAIDIKLGQVDLTLILKLHLKDHAFIADPEVKRSYSVWVIISAKRLLDQPVYSPVEVYIKQK